MAYEKHESAILPSMSLRQGHRINARLQAAMNHAIECELQMAEELDLKEITHGVVNGFCGILTQCWHNICATDGQEKADAFTLHVMRRMQNTWSQNRNDYISKAVLVGRVNLNSHATGNT